MSEPIRSISRRRFGLALPLPWLAGCGFGPFEPLREFDSRTGSLRIVTPWGDDLRERFERSFAGWLVDQSMAPVSIRWLSVSDGKLAVSSMAYVLSASDVILGGHRMDHLRSQSPGLIHAELKPCRFPVTRTIRPIDPPASIKSTSTSSTSETSSSQPETPADHHFPFDFGDDSNDPVVRAYFLSIFEDAPDQATGYARWIRTVGNSAVSGSRMSAPRRVVSLSENSKIDRSRESLWTGGTGTSRTLGIRESEPIHWPEAMSWRNDRGSDTNLERLLRHCDDAGWILRKAIPKVSETYSTVVRDSMARIVYEDCRTELRQAWAEIRTSNGERREEAETYLTALPPWPPASIQSLRQERGFEFVVALADQMAIDGEQRDWLVEEFGKPGGSIDFRSLETADRGSLIQSTRLLAWLHAEWTAWLKQRCRRTVRYLRTSAASRSRHTGFQRSGASFFS